MSHKILNGFNVWITAQGLKSKGRLKNLDNISLEGIARLRELILELAVRGKRVPQDPSDKSAAVLLATIEQEKARSVVSGVIDKKNILPGN